MSRRLIKFVSVFAFLACIGSSFILYHQSIDSLQSEAVLSNKLLENLTTAKIINNYLQQSNDRTREEFSKRHDLFTLAEIQRRTSNEANWASHSKTSGQIKADLSKNLPPDETVVTKWLGNILFQIILEEEKSYSKSNINVAPAAILATPKWSILFVIILFTALVTAFSVGLIYGLNKNKVQE